MSLRLHPALTAAAVIDERVAQAVEAHTPGIRLGYAERVTTFSATSSQLIPLLSVTVVGTGRPVEVKFFCPRVWHSVANTYVSGRIFEDGVQAADNGVLSPSTSSGPGLITLYEPTIALGVSKTYTVQAFIGAAGTMNFYSAANSRAFLSVKSA